MKNNFRFYLSLLLIAAACSGLQARHFAAGLSVGFTLPYTDFVQEPDRHPAVGATFELGIGNSLDITASPYFTRISGNNTNSLPLGTYDALLAGLNLALVYKPANKGALRFKSGLIDRISPYGALGLGAMYYDTEGEISSQPFEHSKATIVLPSLGAGIAVHFQRGLEAEVGFVYVYPWDDAIDNRPQNNLNDSFLMPALTLKYRFD